MSPEIPTEAMQWLEEAKALIMLYTERASLQDDLWPGGYNRDEEERSEVAKQVAQLSQRISNTIKTLRTIEQASAVPIGCRSLLPEADDAVLATVAVLAAAAIHDESKSELSSIGRLANLVAGASVEDALQVRFCFSSDGCLRPHVSMGDAESLEECRQPSLLENSFRTVLALGPDIAFRGQPAGPVRSRW